MLLNASISYLKRSYFTIKLTDFSRLMDLFIL